MKFSSSLRFNAVSEWWDEYIAYDALKKYIYQLEKQQHDQGRSSMDLESGESTLLIPRTSTSSSTDSAFVPLLDRELKKIVFFYESQEKESLDAVSELEELAKEQEENGFWENGQYEGSEDDDDDDDEDDPTHSPSRGGETWPSRRRRRRSSVGPRYVAGSTIPEETSVRRYSTSSSEGNGTDLEASFASVNQQPPPIHTGTRERATSSSSKSPMATATRSLANTFGFMRDSFTSSGSGDNIWTAKSDYALDTRMLFKRKITTSYISLTSLKSYVEVNYSGFRKILKKYDKVNYSELKDHYLHNVVETAVPFQRPAKDRLADGIARLQNLYAKCVTRGDRSAAVQQLKLNQRENIAWERDTVWRQMIGRERRGDGDGETKAIGATLVTEPEGGLLQVPTPVGRFRLTRKKIYLVISIVVFIVLLNVSVLEDVEPNKCFAILVFSTIMWATEAIPLFVTSILVPLLLVMLRVMRDSDGNTLSSPDATHFVFSQMFSPTIMLLIGGFTIASALSKTNIDRVLITRVLSLAGTRPSTVLLAFMGVSCFASMWISNVAAPTLCFTLIRPILRTLPPKSSFGPALILAIALAANIGGQSSPISSPQNLIALAAMEPTLDWGSWFIVALPVSAISLVLIWLLLLVSYRPARSPDGEGEIEIKTIRPTKEAFTLKQYWVTIVCLVTIALWCVAHSIENIVGDMGIIAIIPIVAFFGTGVLKKDDFEQFAWTIVFLAMGGIALGQGVSNSGLLDIMGDAIQDSVDGFSLSTVVFILSPIVLIISTFISHTIASVLLVPIAKEVGRTLPGNHANLLIFITGLICSAGMGMPVSGFPNQTAATQEDELGQLYLSNVDFLKNGVPASIIATLVVATIGFLLMKAIGL